LLDGAEKLADGMTGIAVAKASQMLVECARREQASLGSAISGPSSA
jgi:hypothetical protein